MLYVNCSSMNKFFYFILMVSYTHLVDHKPMTSDLTLHPVLTREGGAFELELIGFYEQN
jgi:hypothetical protein